MNSCKHSDHSFLGHLVHFLWCQTSTNKYSIKCWFVSIAKCLDLGVNFFHEYFNVGLLRLRDHIVNPLLDLCGGSIVRSLGGYNLNGLRSPRKNWNNGKETRNW